MNFLKLLPLGLLWGCAYVGVELVPQKMQPLPDFAEVTMVSGNHTPFAVTDFEDVRPIQDRVGEAKTGLSNTTTPIVLQGSTSDYVRERIETGLRKRGVAIRADSSLQLRGRIVELWVNEIVDSKNTGTERSQCHVKLNLEFFGQTQKLPLWSGEIVVTAASKATFLDTTDLNGPMLESCMNEVLEKLVREEKFHSVTGISALKK